MPPLGGHHKTAMLYGNNILISARSDSKEFVPNKEERTLPRREARVPRLRQKFVGMAPFGKVNVSPGKQETCIPDAPPTDFAGVQPRRRRQKITVRRQPENFGLRTSEQFPVPKTPFQNPVRSATNGFAWHAKINPPTPALDPRQITKMLLNRKFRTGIGKGIYRGRELPEPRDSPALRQLASRLRYRAPGFA
jgi:hypothetical protein